MPELCKSTPTPKTQAALAGCTSTAHAIYLPQHTRIRSQLQAARHPRSHACPPALASFLEWCVRGLFGSGFGHRLGEFLQPHPAFVIWSKFWFPKFIFGSTQNSFRKKTGATFWARKWTPFLVHFLAPGAPNTVNNNVWRPWVQKVDQKCGPFSGSKSGTRFFPKLNL